jgi:predicted GIY-YIG superfamily endonuclease
VDDYQNVCYLIHLERPINKSGTQHYIGFAVSLDDRIAKHRTSKGARVLKRANALGIKWEVVRVWRDGSREAELGLKHFGGKNLCPKCSKFRRANTQQIDTVQGRT